MPKVIWRLKLEADLGEGSATEIEVGRIEREDLADPEESGRNLGGYAVKRRQPSRRRPSKTDTLASRTRCAPRGDQRIWRRLFMR